MTFAWLTVCHPLFYFVVIQVIPLFCETEFDFGIHVTKWIITEQNEWITEHGLTFILWHPLSFLSLCRLCAHRLGGVVGSALPCQHCQPFMSWWGFESGQEARRRCSVDEGIMSVRRIRLQDLQYEMFVRNLESDLPPCASRCCRENWLHNTNPPDATTATWLIRRDDLMLCCCKGPVSLYLNDESDRSWDFFFLPKNLPPFSSVLSCMYAVADLLI